MRFFVNRTMASFDIKSVAVVGGGPAGIASVYELLHTERGGGSTITADGQRKKAENPQFTKIVGFEQKEKAGGSWYPSFDDTGLLVPPQDLMETEKYDDPQVIDPVWEPPEGILNSLVDHPVIAKHDQRAQDLQWAKSGLYEYLYTNVPSRFTRFSYIEFEEKYRDELRTIYPFMSQVELCGRIQGFIEKEHIDEHYRFNSRVERVEKTDSGKWRLTIRKTGPQHDEWYVEEFDAIISAIGHFSVPRFPHTIGLSEFTKNFPGVVSHAKHYRHHSEFENKKVLVVGGSVSAINTLTYVLPRAKSFTVATRRDNKIFEWINKALDAPDIVTRPPIKEIDGKTGVITFEDGSQDSGFEKIVFSTGYHFNFPFLDKVADINVKKDGKVSGFYRNTFLVEDPTIAAVGITGSTMTFACMETCAAAICGVWSGVADLPPKEEQLKWEEERKKVATDRGFHYYTHKEVVDQFIDPMAKYFAKNRISPLHYDRDHISDIDIGWNRVEKIFNKFRLGQLTIEDTLYT